MQVYKILTFLGIIPIAYYLILTSIMGQVTFSEFFLYLGIALMLYGGANWKFKLYKNKKYLKTRTVLRIIISIIMVIFIVVEGIIVGFGMKKNEEQCDYNIVLGAGLKGESMTLSLRERMEVALEYNKDKKNYIVLTGGKGPGESIPEAMAMKKYLIENGIEEKRILTEDKSRNTFQNFNFSKEIIENHSGKELSTIKITITTSNYHCFRSNLLARGAGYGDIYFLPNKTNMLLAPTYYVREFFGIIKSVVFDR